MQDAITHRFAGVPVSDLDASVDWYARFFGRLPDRRIGEEVHQAAGPPVELDRPADRGLAQPRERAWWIGA